MAHGKKAYGEDSFQKTGVRGFCKPLRISRIKKTAGSEKRNCHLFYVCTCILYLSYFISQLSRRARFKILPVAFFGRASRGIKRLGIL